MKRRDPAGHHEASGWRVLTVTAGFLVLMGTFGILIEAKVYAWMMLVFAPCLAFIGGYCFRQQVLNTGTQPRFRFLWLKEDLQPGGLAAQEYAINSQPSVYPPGEVRAARKRLWRRMLMIHGAVLVASAIAAAATGEVLIVLAVIGYEVLILPFIWFILFKAEPE